MALTKIKADGLTADLIDETKIADNGIDSEHYNDGSIDHEHLANDAVDGDNIADNSVGLAHMAGGTDGVIITYDANGDPVHVGPGTDGQVLTSTGAGSPPAFEDVPAGGATINNATENELVTVASTTTQLDAEANLTFDGNNLTLGDGNVIFADGHGIDFSADAHESGMTSELLDDYEEGTFTVTCSTNVTLESGKDLLQYVKVGQMVTIFGGMKVDDSDPSGTYGHLTLDNLPFTVNSPGEWAGEGSVLARYGLMTAADIDGGYNKTTWNYHMNLYSTSAGMFRSIDTNNKWWW